MSLRERASYYIERQRHSIVSSNEMTKTIFEYIQLQIDNMITVDDQTLNMKHGTKEGKIAAQASKNTLTLVRELLLK